MTNLLRGIIHTVLNAILLGFNSLYDCYQYTSIIHNIITSELFDTEKIFLIQFVTAVVFAFNYNMIAVISDII